MANRKSLFSCGIVFMLTVFVAEGAFHQCSGSHQIDLDKVKLDIVWLEPKEVQNADVAEFLNDKRDEWFGQFHDGVVEVFKNVDVKMVQVVDDSSQKWSCLKGPLPDKAAFAAERVGNNGVTKTMLKAAALAANALFRPTQEEPANSGVQVLRLIAMLAETYDDAEMERKNQDRPLDAEFAGDGTDTCKAGLPYQKQTKDLLQQKGIGFLLVTPEARTIEQWTKASFGEENALALDSSEEEASLAPEGCKYVPWKYEVVHFVKQQALRLACQRGQQGGGTTTKTVTTKTRVAATEAVATTAEAVATTTEAAATTTEAVATTTEAVATTTEAVASTTQAVASTTEAVGTATLLTPSTGTTSLTKLTLTKSAASGFPFRLYLAYSVGTLAVISIHV